jgi:HlyD family secretion protein
MQIRLSPEVVQNVVSYDVILEVSNPEMLLKPGMTANVTVEIERADDVLKVPAAALSFHPNIAGNNATSGESNAMAAVTKPSSVEPESTQRAGYSARKKPNTPHLWVLNQQGHLRPIPVRVGITDGLFTEVISVDLREGEQVVTGQEDGTTSSNSQQVNPFMPRFGGRRR